MKKVNDLPGDKFKWIKSLVRCKNFLTPVLCTLLTMCLLPSISAQDIHLKPPGRLSVCAIETITLHITAGAEDLENASLQIEMPCGLHYRPGSASETEADISDTGNPVFELADLQAGEEREFVFEVEVSCETRVCIDDGELFYFGFTLTHNGEPTELLSEPFNVETGNLVIVRVDTLVMQGALHQTITRRFTIRNTRLGRISSFTFMDEYSDQLEITHQTGNTLANEPGLRISELSAVHFRQVGNRDDYLDFGEEVVIEQTIRIIACAYEGRFAASRWTVDWGCGEESCQSNVMQGTVNIRQVNIPGDVLNFTPMRRKEPNCYRGGTAEQRLTFSWPITPIEIDQFVIEIYTTQFGRGIVEGSINEHWIDTVIYNNLKLNECGQFISDKAIIFLNDINLQNSSSRRINWLLGYCYEGIEDLLSTSWEYNYRYNKKCQIPVFQTFDSENKTVGNKLNKVFNFNFNLIDQGLYLENDTFILSFEIENSKLSKEVGELQVEVKIPNHLIVNDTNVIIKNSSPIDIKFMDVDSFKTIRLNYDLPISDNRISFDLKGIINCIDLNWPCKPNLNEACKNLLHVMGNTTSLIGSVNLKIEEECDSIILLKDSTIIDLVIACWGESCDNQIPGHFDYNFHIKRTSFGQPDKNNNGIPDEDDMHNYHQLELDHMIPGDTFIIEIIGAIKTDSLSISIDSLVWKLSFLDIYQFYGEDIFREGMLGTGMGLENFNNKLEIYCSENELWFKINAYPSIYCTLKKEQILTVKTDSLYYYNSEIPKEFKLNHSDSLRIISSIKVTRNMTRGIGSNPFWEFSSSRYSFRNMMELLVKSSINLNNTANPRFVNNYFCNEKENIIYISGYGITIEPIFVRDLSLGDCLNFNKNLVPLVRLREGFIPKNNYKSVVLKTNSEIRQKRILREIHIKQPSGLNIDTLFVGRRLQDCLDCSIHLPYFQDNSVSKFRIFEEDGFNSRHNQIYLFAKFENPECGNLDKLGNIEFELHFDTLSNLGNFPIHSNVTVGYSLEIPKVFNNLDVSNVKFINKFDSIEIELVSSNSQAKNIFLKIITSNGLIINDFSTNYEIIFKEDIGLILFDSLPIPLTLHATSTSCQPEQIIIEYGYDCDVWTDPVREPCFLARDTITIEVLHGLMDMQTEEEDKEVDLCTQISTQTLYFNAELGHAYDVQAEVILPRGMQIVPGSAVLIYPAGSDNEMVIGNPQLLEGRHYQWWMDDWMLDWIEEGLPGVETIPGNDFEIRFEVETDCDFISGTRIIHSITAHKVCGLRTNRRAKVDAPIHITDAEQPYSMNLQASTQGSAVCGNEMVVQAQMNIPAGEVTRIYLSLAPGMSFVEGSASSSVALTNEQQDGNIWSWELIGAEGSTSFSAHFISAGDCQDALIEVFVTSETEAVCAATQAPCDIEIVTGSRLLPVRIDKPVYDFSRVEMLLPDEPGQGARMSVGLQHSGVISPEPIHINLYRDVNGNGQIDGDDIFVKSFTVGPFEEEGQVLEVILDLPDMLAADYCNLLLELNEAENCVCEGLLRNVGGNVRLLADEFDLCHDQEISIGVEPTTGHSYQWNTETGMNCTQCPETTFFIANESIFLENYERILTETTADGCRIDHHFSLQVHPRTEILSGDQLVCAGEEIELIANTAQSYHWTGDNIQQNGMQILRVKPRVSGYYFLEAPGLEQCGSRDSVFVEVLPAPTEQFPDGIEFCFGGSSIIDIQPEEGVRYEWLNGEDRLSALDIANPEVLLEEPFTFILAAENPVCRAVSEIEVNFVTAFEIEGLPESLEVCVGDTIFLDLSGGISYEWSEDMSAFCVDTICESLVIPVDFEEWHLSILARDEEGCISAAETILIGTRDTLLNEESLMICEGEEVELFGQWVNEAGYYCDTTRIAGECLRVDCIDLRLLALDEIEKEAQICRGDTYDFLNDRLTESGLYCYDFINQDGCDSTICLQLVVTELPLIELQAFYSAMEGDIIQLSLPTHYESYQWEPAHLFDCPECPEVNITASQSGTYEVWVTDSSGCQSYHAFQLEVIIPCEAIHAKLPNAFTPNDDGINDSYYIRGLEYCGPAELIVFNRWGNEVYRQSNYDNNWRGQSSNGEELPQGTYFVVLEYKEYGIIKQGMVDLRRR